MAVKTKPDGYHSLTAYLVVRGASKAVEFYKAAFGAVEHMRMPGPNDTVMHGELIVGDSIFMYCDENPEWGSRGRSPLTLGGSPVSFMIYVDDVDAAFARAIAAGAVQERPMTDQFYGDRTGTLTDPFGHMWTLATHIEDVSPEEMQKRLAAMM